MPIRDRSPIIFGDRVNTLQVIAENNSVSINSNNILNTNTMASVSQLEISMAKDMIPEYSGGSKNLAYFIKQVEYYIELFKREDEQCLFNKLIFEHIKSKLIGNARDILITSNCNTWSELKISLLQRFGDPRSEELLLHDLNTCYQLPSESYEQYYEKIKNKLQVLLEHININSNSRDIKICKEEMYVRQALTTYKAGILEPYCTHLMNMPISTLEQALFSCRKYDNEKSQAHFMNFMRNRSKPMTRPNNQNKPHIPSNNSRPNFYPFATHNQSNHNNFRQPFQFPKSQFNTSNHFPRGPINIQPRPIKQNFPTNSQVFGRKPDSKPTPMSISTRNTFPRPQQQQSLQQSKPPTFAFEELHNSEPNESFYDNYDLTYEDESYLITENPNQQHVKNVDPYDDETINYNINSPNYEYPEHLNFQKAQSPLPDT